jgi:hypothetical protein
MSAARLAVDGWNLSCICGATPHRPEEPILMAVEYAVIVMSNSPTVPYPFRSIWTPLHRRNLTLKQNV